MIICRKVIQNVIILSPSCIITIIGIQCPHRGAVYSFTWRHKAYPYTHDDRDACNVFFIWEMLRPLLKGDYLYFVLF